MPKALIVTGIKYLRDEYASRLRREGYETHIARNALEGQSMYFINGIRGNGVMLIDSTLYGSRDAVSNIYERDGDAKIIQFDSTTFDGLDGLVDNANRLTGKKDAAFDLAAQVMAKLSIVAGLRT